MDLNINSPAYYTNQYGINDSVYKYCQSCYKFFKDKDYSEILETIGIIPVIEPKDVLENGKKEKVQMWGNNCVACVSIIINYNEYCSADDNEKIKLMRTAILKAVKKVSSKVKFDYKSFESDLISLR